MKRAKRRASCVPRTKKVKTPAPSNAKHVVTAKSLFPAAPNVPSATQEKPASESMEHVSSARSDSSARLKLLLRPAHHVQQASLQKSEVPSAERANLASTATFPLDCAKIAIPVSFATVS